MPPPPLTYKQVAAADLPIDIFKKLRGHSQTTLIARGEGGYEMSMVLNKYHKFFYVKLSTRRGGTADTTRVGRN